MQQLKLTFQTEYPTLPQDLDRLLVSFIKASAQNYSQDFFDVLYDKDRSIIKPFTFSTYLPGARFVEDRILLGQPGFTMYFSDADLGQIIQFFNAFCLMKMKKYPVSGNTMQLTSVMLQKRKEITDSEVIVKISSSLIVRRHYQEDNSDQYYTFDQPEFGKALKENVEIFVQKLGLQVPTDTFSIMPLKGKKVVARVFGRPVDASIGAYKLTGSPELLNLLYLAGLGVRRSSGHGKFEILM